jgi:hypothetical protein
MQPQQSRPLAEQNLESAYFFVESINEWAQIIGNCLLDGEFRLIWKYSQNKLGLIDLDTLKKLSKETIPF